MKRHLWSQTITEHYCPTWPCPVCSKGTLILVPKSLVFRETAESKRQHDADGWEPDRITYAFTAWAKCGNRFCGQECAISGTGGVEPNFDPEEGTDFCNQFHPRNCFPMPDIFEITKKCPDDIKKALRSAFALFWADFSASAGRIRVAIERIMDYLKIQKKKKNKNGKFSKLSLHQRIEIFEKRDSLIGKQLLALKWVGNTGSHEQKIGQGDLLDAFEILEHALAELIDREIY